MTVDVQWLKTVRCMQRCLCIVSGAWGPFFATFGRFPEILGETKLSEPLFEEGDVVQEHETTVTVSHSEKERREKEPKHNKTKRLT